MISLFSEEIEFAYSDEASLLSWISKVINDEGKELGPISYIFCSDEYLLNMNRTHLNHDYYTDIITFQYSDTPISGDLFISIDRVTDNAKDLSISFNDELDRVIIHGILHLIGYGDKTESEALVMRQKEDFYLSVR